MSRNALIIANGEAPGAALLRKLVAVADQVVCADGGANTARALGIRPDAIVGDFDSITGATRVHFRDVTTHEDQDEYSTDLEKSVRWAIAHECRDITIIGALGRRLDHTVGNLGVLPKFHAEARIRVVDDPGEMSYVGREVRFEAPVGDIVSLVPLNRCSGITTTGLKYALENDTLELGTRDGTSNVVIASPVVVRVASGHLLLYRVYGAAPDPAG
jgi:thiamine pyrophosphokinase